jgi:hypothetical protein
VEGLFGIRPNALKKELLIKPGLPAAWDSAALQTPDINFRFTRNGKKETYRIEAFFESSLQLKLIIRANGSLVKRVLVNGKTAGWKNADDAVGTPLIEIDAAPQKKYQVDIAWQGTKATVAGKKKKYVNGDTLELSFPGATIGGLYDPQHTLQHVQRNKDRLTGFVNTITGNHSFFVQLKQNRFSYWYPIDFEVREKLSIRYDFLQPVDGLQFKFINNSSRQITGRVFINPGERSFSAPFTISGNSVSSTINIPADLVVPGTNTIQCRIASGDTMGFAIINWSVQQPVQKMETVDLSNYFNDKVTRIFKNQYLSPRPATATLQLPTQGIGDWTHPLKTADIDDSGLRKLAGSGNRFSLPQGIVFATPSDTINKNILFTAQWDNYPKQMSIPLTGYASHLYLLMAGSTNPMQSRMINGMIEVFYTDGTCDSLLLQNPQTWWPIEQDYMDDGYAFRIDAARPVRVHLKTGKIVSDLDHSIAAYDGKMIEGGAATVLDLPLNKNKTLQSLQLQTISNDVVIGLMSVTLERN